LPSAFPAWARLAAVALLAAFELGVLALATQPRVSEAYRLRYIARSSGCYAAPAWRARILARARPQRLVFAGMSPRTACVWLPDGWHVPGAAGVETKEARARIMVPAGPSARRATLTLAGLDQDRPLAVSWQGHALWNGMVPAGRESRLSLALPAGAADRDGLVRLDLGNGRREGNLGLSLRTLAVD
jgi:hypothetical protein